MNRYSAEQLAQWSGGIWEPSPPLCGFPSIGHDTRVLSRGAVYLALEGEVHDGHQFVADAIRGGASAAIVTARWQPGAGQGVPLLRVPDTRQALQKLAGGYLRHVAPQLIAVTGSAGKTTVKDLLAAVLGVTRHVAATEGNWNNQIGYPLTLLAMDPGTEIAVCEMGTSHPGDIEELCAIGAPDISLVTSIGPAHLEYFGTTENIAREKAGILRALKPGGTAVLDRQCLHYPLLTQALSEPPVTVALETPADYTGNLLTDEPALRVRENATGSVEVLPLPLPGRHQALNVLFATAVARQAGMSWSAIRAGLQGFRPSAMRWQTVSIGKLLFINDAYNANPLSMTEAIRTFMDTANHDVPQWVIAGDMLELGPSAQEAHERIGTLLGRCSLAGILAVGTYAPFVAGAAQAAGAGGVVAACGCAEDAAAFLRHAVARGPARILLKGSRGMHLEQVLEVFSQHKRSTCHADSCRL